MHTKISDHNLIFAVRKIDHHRGPPRFVEFRNFKNFDEQKFLENVKIIKWPMPNDTDEINKIWESWKTALWAVLDRHAPCQVKRVCNVPSPWINEHLKKKMYARDFLKKKATKSNSVADWLHFKKKRNAVNQLVKWTKKCYCQKEIENNKGNPIGTWKVLNSLMGNKVKSSEISKVNIDSSKSVTDAKGIANTFNTHFTEIEPKLASQFVTPTHDATFERYLTKVKATLTYIAISRLKPT